MKTILMSMLALTLAGCAGNAGSRPVASNTGGRNTEARVYSLTGEDATRVGAAEHHDYGRRSLPRPTN